MMIDTINAIPVTGKMLNQAMHKVGELSSEDRTTFTGRAGAIVPIIASLDVDAGEGAALLMAIDFRMQALAILVAGGLIDRFRSLGVGTVELRSAMVDAAASLPLRDTPPALTFDADDFDARVRLITQTAGRA